ncbi:TIGR00730 family Rossman fold protein [Leucobacter tardus]|uniref:Cytokinin riboside 5'-monophosphate phosphoribohydrolase n=1 Tax=Leucobacter tardus TaxID=501483 RepID=A0A939TNP2_9MICO|nr:TIGR00730 family Rossman fold protein [Leucobacter tardus]
MPQRITVFTGSSSGASPRFAEIASDFGAALAEQGIGLVYGGGHVGLMGVVADATRQGGSEVVGVIPQGLVDRELAHPNIDRIEVVADMHERKHRMAALGDAFVALPGGPGTLEEFFEALTWMQLGIHNRPVALLNSGGFWDAQLRMLDDMVEHGFMAREFRERIVVAETPAGLFASLREWRPPRAKWQK